jgi:exocyst complex protein 7
MISNNGFEISWIVFNDSKPVEPDRLFECLPDSLRPPSSGSPRNHGDGSGKSLMDHQEKSLENAVYTLPILIPPRVLPLLHDLAQQMAQAGHQQQLFRIYR